MLRSPLGTATEELKSWKKSSTSRFKLLEILQILLLNRAKHFQLYKISTLCLSKAQHRKFIRFSIAAFGWRVMKRKTLRTLNSGYKMWLQLFFKIPFWCSFFCVREKTKRRRKSNLRLNLTHLYLHHPQDQRKWKMSLLMIFNSAALVLLKPLTEYVDELQYWLRFHSELGDEFFYRLLCWKTPSELQVDLHPAFDQPPAEVKLFFFPFTCVTNRK